MSVNPPSLAFAAFEIDPGTEEKTLTVSWTGANVAGYVVGTLPGVPALPSWLEVSAPAPGGGSPSTLTVRRTAVPLAPGQYSTTIRIVTGDANANPLAQADVPITLEVVAKPTIAPSDLSVSWVESEQPAAQSLTVTRPDNRIQLVSVTSNVAWLNATAAGDTITVAGTPEARSVAPGNVSGTLRATFSVANGGTTAVDVPVTGLVSFALGGPALPVIEFEVNGSTEAADLLNRTATVASATQAPVQFSASSNVPWITGGTGMTTGAPDNLVLNLQGTEIATMENGEHDGLITITPTTPNISPVQIPVRLKLRLPEVRLVGPVAFTDALDSDYVVVQGGGLDDPSIDLRVDGVPVPPASLTVVSDAQVRVVPGVGLAPGDHAVTVSNRLGYARSAGTLRVTDPPAYGAFSLDAPVGSPWGLQERILSSPINATVFAARCYFCGGGGATAATVNRFVHDSGTWTHSAHPYPELYDVALTPDESLLLVLTSTDLLLVDPLTMATHETHPLPAFNGGNARQLAVANDGLVLIGDSTQAFSLVSRTFVNAPAGYSLGRAPVASRDGSRVLLAFGTQAPVQHYDAATGTIVDGTDFVSDPRASIDRHGTTAFIGGGAYDADFMLRGMAAVPIGELSPDGTRVYYADVDESDLEGFDLGTTPFSPLATIDVPGVPAPAVARIGVDAHGGAVFYVTEDRFVVLDLP